MQNQQTSYRQIMKATSLFGGVQVFNIIISIVRSKIVAVFLGPAGMGVMGLLTSTTGIISSLTNFGLGTSAVKNIAEASGTADQNRIATVVTAFRRMVWFTGLLGLIVTLILSPWLSQLTFGNKKYTLAFIWLSVSLLFNQLCSGQMVLLQGMRKLKYLAKADVVGNSIGLLITLPLYYFFGIDGIVPGIIGTSVISLFVALYFSRKVQVTNIAISHSQTILEGKGMLKMGLMISLSGLLSLGAAYIVRIFISRTGGVEQVGLYSAGFAIINTYVGMIFSAMATDYYPRLSAVSYDNNLSKQIVNHQAEIALLILAPILIIFLVFINWAVILLYSKQFLGVSDMIYWAALGMFFKAASWPIGYIFLAKSKGKIFMWSELAANTYTLIFNIIGYYYWGLTGIGISFLLSYVLILLQVFYIGKIKFEFSFYSSFINIFIYQFSLALAGFFTLKFLTQPYTYLLGLLLISISTWYSVKELNKRLGLLTILKNYRKK